MMEKYNRPYFEQHKCDICKAPANFYRYSVKTQKGQMLCASEKCNHISLINTGFISLIVSKL